MFTDAFKHLVPMLIGIGAVIGAAAVGVIWLIGHYLIPHMHFFWK